MQRFSKWPITQAGNSVRSVVYILLCLSLTNCGKVDFDQSHSSQGSDNGGANAQGTPNSTGGNTSTDPNGNSATGTAGTGTTPAGTGPATTITQPNGTTTVNQPGAGPQGGDLSNAGGPSSPITGLGNSSAAILPKVKFIGPPCERMTNCSITFELDKAYASQVEFDWKTRDDLFGKPVATGAYPWGQPDIQYIRTSGHVVFASGVTSATVYVRNINPQNQSISIGVEMNNCTYNTKLESCQKYFAP